MNDARGNGILFFSSSIESFPLWGPGRRGAFNFSSSSFWKSSFDVFPRRKTHHKKREREREPFPFVKEGGERTRREKNGEGFSFFFLFFPKIESKERRAPSFFMNTRRLTPKGFLSLRLPLSFGSMSKHRRINTDDTR